MIRGVRRSLLVLALFAAATSVAAPVGGPEADDAPTTWLLVAPADREVRDVALSFHAKTGLPMVVVTGTRRIPRGTALDSPRRLQIQLWMNRRPHSTRWASLAAAVGALAPEQILVFGDKNYVPEHWFEDVPRRFPRVRFISQDDALQYFHHAEKTTRERMAATRNRPPAPRPTTSVPPSPARTDRLLAMPPKYRTSPRGPQGPAAVATTTIAPGPADQPEPPPADDGPVGDTPTATDVTASTTTGEPPAPEVAPRPAEEPAPDEDAGPVDGSATASTDTPGNAMAAPDLPVIDPTADPLPPPAPIEGDRPSLENLEARQAYARELSALPTGNAGLADVLGRMERTLDWAGQVHLARSGGSGSAVNAAQVAMSAEVDRLRDAIAVVRDRAAEVAGEFSALRAEKEDFEPLEPPTDGVARMAAATALAAYRAGTVSNIDLRDDDSRYEAVRNGLALEEELEDRLNNFETAARSFVR